MTKFFYFSMLSLFFCCTPAVHQSIILTSHYSNPEWKSLVSKLLTDELPNLCTSWPVEWGVCSVDSSSLMSCFNSIDIDSNLSIIDSLVTSNNLTKKDDYEIMVQEQFSDGFNAWHCTRFIISQNKSNKQIGIKTCKTGIDRDPMLLKLEKPVKEILDLTEDQMKSYFKLKTGTYSTNDIIAITTIDQNYHIKKCRIILYP